MQLSNVLGYGVGKLFFMPNAKCHMPNQHGQLAYTGPTELYNQHIFTVVTNYDSL